MNYPRFEQYQLLDYKGNNSLIIKLKQKYVNYLLSKSDDNLNELEYNVKKRKPIYLIINPSSYGHVIETLNNIKGRKKYYIKCFHNKNVNQKRYISVYKEDFMLLSEEQNEYLLKNFLYNPFLLDNALKLDVGQLNEKFLNQQFNTDKKIKQITIDSIAGETDNFFHFTYKNNDFFLKKEDEKLKNPIHELIDSTPFDEDYYNELCQWPEWKEKNYKLTSHQIIGIKSILHFKRFAIFDRAGTGKTILSICAALASGSKKILVVTQLNLKTQWIDFIKHFQESVTSFDSNFDDLDEFSKFHVIHYNQLDNNRGSKKHKYDFNQFDYDFIIADEAHEVKNITGIRGKYIKKLISKKSCEYVVPLTASPFETNEQVYQIYYNFGINANGMIPVDEYNFQKIIDKQNEFKIRYCNGIFMKKNGKSFVTTFGDSNTYELAQRLKYSFLCRTSNDIEGFPDIKIHTMNFNMGAVANSEYLRYKTELKEHYEKMKAKMGDNMTINEDLPILSKIREFLAEQAAEQTVNLARLKVKQGKKVIIFTHFQSEFDLLTQYLNEDAVWVHVTKKNRWNREENDDIIKLFKTSPDKNILIGNIKTLGTGHNIPQADVAILNSPNWAYGEHMQAMSRPRRLNRAEQVDVFFWMIKDTEIEKVFETNERKRKNTNILLGLPIDFF